MGVDPAWRFDREDITADAQDRLRELVLKSYSDPRIFVRELAQNAAGAGATALWIDLVSVKDDPSRVLWLTVRDNGRGLGREDLRACLSSLGQGEDPLGQLGAGFFSTLAGSDHVEICSRKSGGEVVRAAYRRIYDDAGNAWLEPGAGDADEAVAASYGLSGVSGTTVRIRFPFHGRRSNLEIRKDIVSVVDQWCKYLDMEIYLGTEKIKAPIDLHGRIRTKFDEEIVYRDPVSNVERTIRLSGMLGISTVSDVKLLKHGIVVQPENLYHGGKMATRICGFINCDSFELSGTRTSVIRVSGQASGAIYDAVMQRATQHIDALFEQLIAQPVWEGFEAQFVRERCFGYFKEKGHAGLAEHQKIARGIPNLVENRELMQRIVWLKSIAGPGTAGDPAIGKEATVYDIWSAIQTNRLLFWADRLDPIVEDLGRAGQLVVSRQEANSDELLQALVGITAGAVVESAEALERADAYREKGSLTARETEFVELCRLLDPAVVLVEPVRPNDPRALWVQGYYGGAVGGQAEVIGLNVANRFVAEALARVETDPVMAGLLVFRTILHARSHQAKSAHNEDFLRTLEPLLDAKMGPWFDQLRARYGSARAG